MYGNVQTERTGCASFVGSSPVAATAICEAPSGRLLGALCRVRVCSTSSPHSGVARTLFRAAVFSLSPPVQLGQPLPDCNTARELGSAVLTVWTVEFED